MSEQVSSAVYALDASKSWKVFGSYEATAVTQIIPGLFQSKGFDLEAIQALSRIGLLGPSIDTFLLGNGVTGASVFERETRDERQRYLSDVIPPAYGRIASNEPRAGRAIYDGTHLSNGVLMAGFTRAAIQHTSDSPLLQRQRGFRRNGASARLLTIDPVRVDGRVEGIPSPISTVPIAIVGGGASGVLASGLLAGMGFGNITMFEKRRETNGLWRQDNVRTGTKNNPFDINFLGIETKAADEQYVAGSGTDIDNFITQIRQRFVDPRYLTLRHAVVDEIQPGDLDHRITYRDKNTGQRHEQSFPIVIYAPGIGAPLNPNHPHRMKTPMKGRELGERWQRQFSRDDLHKLGNRVILVGLGNSTAEVVHQLQQQAPRIDYRILTHRSFEAILDPRATVSDTNSSIYRDITKPELGKLAGDLPHIDLMYQRALREGKIITDVREWSHEGGVMTVSHRSGVQTTIPFSKLFTLIGYGHDPAVNDAMGLSMADERTGSIDYDFDGEVHKKPEDYNAFAQSSRERIYPGYFALGPILKNTYNPNALVIPGIQFQLQQIAGTLLVRAAEATYSRRQRST